MPAVQSYKTPGTHWSSLSIVHILAVCNWNVVSQPLFHYKCKGEREVKKELFRSPSLRRERWGARRGSVDAFLFTGALRFFALYFVWLGACCVWHAKCNACFAAGMLQNTYLTTYIYYKLKNNLPYMDLHNVSLYGEPCASTFLHHVPLGRQYYAVHRLLTAHFPPPPLPSLPFQFRRFFSFE